MAYSTCLLILLVSGFVFSGCPYSQVKDHPIITTGGAPTAKQLADYNEALEKLDWDAVAKDIEILLTDSQDWWPADFGNYGPFFIRQAWHCAGSYRAVDGRGGCDGGRQRFNPERSWDDNANLDKAKKLLWPIKEKYGVGLSWGDLIILTGTVAIKSMGGPFFGFCGGRIDAYDGSESVLLGPTTFQEKYEPCEVNGQCKKPFGATTIGLIYVNPEGPMGEPIPEKSVLEVRDTFGRMNMDDEETIALIGGGHAFGKTHGACPAGPGPNPIQDPTNPWPGACGTGKGNDTYSSGMEGPWTTTPTQWSNNYFKILLGNTWAEALGPGGHHQWHTVNGTPGVMMLTTDISLLHDPANIYQNYVNYFAKNMTAFEDKFARTWYKLTTRDMGPQSRCRGPWVPSPQPFQFPLPKPKKDMPDFAEVRKSIEIAILSSFPGCKADSLYGKPYYGALFVHLAYESSITFRNTDYIGGANGARVRFAPESTWTNNVGMDQVLQLLDSIRKQYKNLSYADIIILAADVALSRSNGFESRFCPGRTDASDGEASKLLIENLTPDATINQIKEYINRSGLTAQEYVALQARPRSVTQYQRQGYSGSYTDKTAFLNHQFFKILLNNSWEKFTNTNNLTEYRTKSTTTGNFMYMTPRDLALYWDPDFLAIAQGFAADNDYFYKVFSSAWNKLVTFDRFDGPVGNVCNN